MIDNHSFTSDMIPLREPTFYILLALSNQKKHGYAIMKDVEMLSAGRVMLSTGTLYGALGRLLDQGLIRRAPDESEGSEEEAGRSRKYYALTQDGRRVLGEEIRRLEELLATARLHLGGETL